MSDLLQIPGFLDADAARELREELQASSRKAATVLSGEMGGTVRSGVRKSSRVAVSEQTLERVVRRLMDGKHLLESHFGLELSTCEEPQFLRYDVGDFFVAHQDGNTPAVFDDSRHRRISAVVFLSTPSAHPEPDTYGGGELVFHGPYNRPTPPVAVAPPPGTLVAFRSETTHEVTPVTHGERFTIATWFR
jgi:SM-20-related protein